MLKFIATRELPHHRGRVSINFDGTIVIQEGRPFGVMIQPGEAFLSERDLDTIRDMMRELRARGWCPPPPGTIVAQSAMCERTACCSDDVLRLLRRLGMAGPNGLIGLVPGQPYPEGTTADCTGSPEVARRFQRVFGPDAGIRLLNAAIRRGWRFVRVGDCETGALSFGALGDVFKNLVDSIVRRLRPARRAASGDAVGSKVIDLGDAPLHFVNSFTDSRFMGISFAGLCGGMAYTTLDYFYTRTPAPLTTTTPSVQHDVLGKYVYGRQVDSLLGWQGLQFLGMLLNRDDAALARDTDASFRELRAAIDAGTPVPIGLIPHPWTLDITKFTSAHQVVARGYEVGEDGSKTVVIWDSNRPNDALTTLYQAPGTTTWIEAGTRTSAEHVWRGFFVESAYTTKQPPLYDENPRELLPGDESGWPLRNDRRLVGLSEAGLLLRPVPGEPPPGRLAGHVEVSRDRGRTWTRARALRKLDPWGRSWER